MTGCNCSIHHIISIDTVPWNNDRRQSSRCRNCSNPSTAFAGERLGCYGDGGSSVGVVTVRVLYAVLGTVLCV